jgi:hypothetical protein
MGALFRRGTADEELDAELHAFLETAVDEKVRSGIECVSYLVAAVILSATSQRRFS